MAKASPSCTVLHFDNYRILKKTALVVGVIRHYIAHGLDPNPSPTLRGRGEGVRALINALESNNFLSVTQLLKIPAHQTLLRRKR